VTLRSSASVLRHPAPRLHWFRASLEYQAIHDRMISRNRNIIPQSIVYMEKSVKQIVLVSLIDIVS
jgi:hypothetical protein